MKIFVLLLSVPIGLLFVIKTDAVVGIVGRFGWAERNLGGAGTFTFYKLLGIAIIFVGVMYATGIINRILGGFIGFFFGNL